MMSSGYVNQGEIESWMTARAVHPVSVVSVCLFASIVSVCLFPVCTFVCYINVILAGSELSTVNIITPFSVLHPGHLGQLKSYSYFVCGESAGNFQFWLFCVDLVTKSTKTKNPEAELQGAIFWQNYQLFD